MPKTKRIIVNADDLGLHPAVNQAIFRAHREGIVSSASLLTGAPAAAEAAREAQNYPELGVGVHLCVIEQTPLSPPEQIPSLLGASGNLHAAHADFIKRFLLGRIRLREVEIELTAQVQRVFDFGLRPTHFDGHQHLHLLPGVADAVIRLGCKFGVKRVRLPAEDTRAANVPVSAVRQMQSLVTAALANWQRRRFVRTGFVAPQHFAGFSYGGRFHKEIWLKLLPNVRPGITEIMTHPGADNHALEQCIGSGYHWEQELQALLDPELKEMMRRYDLELVNFGALS